MAAALLHTKDVKEGDLQDIKRLIAEREREVKK
jgi:hypothetical protein